MPTIINQLHIKRQLSTCVDRQREFNEDAILAATMMQTVPNHATIRRLEIGPQYLAPGRRQSFPAFLHAVALKRSIYGDLVGRGKRLIVPLLQAKPRTGFFFLLISIGFLAGCANLRSDDESSGAQSPPLTVVTSPSHPAASNVDANDKCSQALEWDEVIGTLTAKVTYSKVSGAGTVEADLSDRTFFLPFPTVKLDPKNNLVIGRTFQKALVLGHLENSPNGMRVILRSDIHLLVHRRNGTLSASLVSTSTTS